MQVSLWSKKFRFFLLGICSFPCLILSTPLQFEIEGEAGILMNAESGTILFEKESHQLLFPASTTKIATALFALTVLNNDLHSSVVAESESLKSMSEVNKKKLNYQMPAYWLEPDGTHIAIKMNEDLSFRTLLEGMLISSGNDAANVVAQALGPTIPAFMHRLNAFLKDIGCLNTYYLNPHGLHHPEHVTTAYDLALMTSVALKNSIFCQIVSKIKFERPSTQAQSAATFWQTNRLLRSGEYYYPYAIGVKTGYHSKAKKTFVGAARFQGRTLIVVLLGYKNKNAVFEDAKTIFETAFKQSKVEKTFFSAGPQSFNIDIPRAKNNLKTYMDEDLSLTYYPAEEQDVKCYLSWDPFQLPIAKDRKVGELQLIASGKILKKVDLKAFNSVNLKWPYNWFQNLKNFYRDHFFLSLLYLLLCCTGLISSLLIRNSSSK